ncbi:hypothetical protein F7725_013338 [Dissostichus mawsoni]|uniref:THAP domain-containing protein 1 n=1 Tax=Dissostichus mawsoni TaxID=36200 RepID=A0A7J5YPX3_DISMA|nr:hypothetical protein F7725_013338 [Dissostichus mawsoni]
MPSCVAFNCKKRTAEKGATVSLFRFPHHDKARMLSWVHNINRKNWMPSPDSRLCALHFTEECFHPSCGRSLLNSNAVPTIFAYPVSIHPRNLQLVTHHPKHKRSPTPPGEVAPSTDVTNVVEPMNCSTTVTTNQNSVSDTEVSDGHGSTAPLQNVTVEEQTPFGNILSETAKSPDAQITIRKLQMKVHNMGRKLVISRKRLKVEKQKSRRLNTRISSCSAVIQELNQKLGQMKEEALVMAKTIPKAIPKVSLKASLKAILKVIFKANLEASPKASLKAILKASQKSKPKSKVPGNNLN